MYRIRLNDKLDDGRWNGSMVLQLCPTLPFFLAAAGEGRLSISAASTEEGHHGAHRMHQQHPSFEVNGAKFMVCSFAPRRIRFAGLGYIFLEDDLR